MITREVGGCLDSFLTASTSKVGSRAGCERKAAVPAAGTTGPDTRPGEGLRSAWRRLHMRHTPNGQFIHLRVESGRHLHGFRITRKGGPPSAAYIRLRRPSSRVPCCLVDACLTPLTLIEHPSARLTPRGSRSSVADNSLPPIHISCTRRRQSSCEFRPSTGQDVLRLQGRLVWRSLVRPPNENLTRPLEPSGPLHQRIAILQDVLRNEVAGWPKRLKSSSRAKEEARLR